MEMEVASYRRDRDLIMIEHIFDVSVIVTVFRNINTTTSARLALSFATYAAATIDTARTRARTCSLCIKGRVALLTPNDQQRDTDAY